MILKNVRLYPLEISLYVSVFGYMLGDLTGNTIFYGVKDVLFFSCFLYYCLRIINLPFFARALIILVATVNIFSILRVDSYF